MTSLSLVAGCYRQPDICPNPFFYIWRGTLFGTWPTQSAAQLEFQNAKWKLPYERCNPW